MLHGYLRISHAVSNWPSQHWSGYYQSSVFQNEDPGRPSGRPAEKHRFQERRWGSLIPQAASLRLGHSCLPCDSQEALKQRWTQKLGCGWYSLRALTALKGLKVWCHVCQASEVGSSPEADCIVF